MSLFPHKSLAIFYAVGSYYQAQAPSFNVKRGCLKGSSLDSFSLYTPLKEIMFLHIRGKGKGSILARCTLICCNLVGYSDIGISDVTGLGSPAMLGRARYS